MKSWKLSCWVSSICLYPSPSSRIYTHWLVIVIAIVNANVKPGQIWGYLVCDKLASASTANCCDTSRCHSHHSGMVHPWSQRLYWCRFVNAGARQTNSVAAVFCCSSPITPDLPSGTNSHVPEACNGSCTLVTGLRQCSTGWHRSWYLVRRLQSVLNAAARLIYHLRPYDHISDWWHCSGCTSHNVCSIKLRCSLTNFYTAVQRDIWDLLLPSLTCVVGDLCGQQVTAT